MAATKKQYHTMLVLKGFERKIIFYSKSIFLIRFKFYIILLGLGLIRTIRTLNLNPVYSQN